MAVRAASTPSTSQASTSNQPAAVIASANMQSTSDQAFLWQIPVPTLYVVRRVLFRRLSGAYATACAGGIYTAASKGGTALVAASQSYSGLTNSANKMVDVTLAAVNSTDPQSSSNLYLNLTTGNGAALTAKVYLFIDVIEP